MINGEHIEIPKQVIDKASFKSFVDDMFNIIENDKKTREPLVITEIIEKQ